MCGQGAEKPQGSVQKLGLVNSGVLTVLWLER